MDRITITLGQLDVHVVKFGIDIYPPIVIQEELTHLNIFYEEVRHKYPDLYSEIHSSNTEFTISAQFEKGSHGARATPTFVSTQRGPVFIFPFLLPSPTGDTGLKENYLDIFHDCRKLLLTCLGGARQFLRVGLVRELIFNTGSDRCHELLTTSDNFAAASLKGVHTLISYEDSLCNVRTTMDTIEITSGIQHPVGHRETRKENGLKVEFDVNNREIRPLDDDMIDRIIERANSLWPDELLNNINGSKHL